RWYRRFASGATAGGRRETRGAPSAAERSARRPGASMRGALGTMAAMTWRVLVLLLIVALVVLPVAQHASVPRDGGHAVALKHAPRTPPSGARAADVVRALPVVPPPARASLLWAPPADSA